MIDGKWNLGPKGSHGASGEGCPLSSNQIGLALLSDWLNAFKWTPGLTIGISIHEGECLWKLLLFVAPDGVQEEAGINLSLLWPWYLSKEYVNYHKKNKTEALTCIATISSCFILPFVSTSKQAPRKSGGQSYSPDGAHTCCWVILIGVKFYSTFKII